MENPAPKNVVITIKFTTNMVGVFCVSLALLLLHSLFYDPGASEVSHKTCWWQADNPHSQVEINYNNHDLFVVSSSPAVSVCAVGRLWRARPSTWSWTCRPPRHASRTSTMRTHAWGNSRRKLRRLNQKVTLKILSVFWANYLLLWKHLVAVLFIYMLKKCDCFLKVAELIHWTKFDLLSLLVTEHKCISKTIMNNNGSM